MKRIVKIAIFIFLLWWPVSYAFKLIDERPFYGEYEQASDIEFSKADWLSGNYQAAKEKYLNENFMLRRTLVRLHNEIGFRCFDSIQTQAVVMGRDGYLFGGDYINTYFGQYFVGTKRINENVRKLKVISDSLQRNNVELIVVIAPGKGSFYHEHFPAYTDSWKRDTTNYETYSNALRKADLHFIDFNNYFLKLKASSKYTLFPKTGIHWSNYGMTLCLDSMLKYIEATKKIDMPDLKIKKIIQTDSVSDADMDVELGMNLLFSLSKLPMAYPILETNEKNKTKPKCLVIGDSFYWPIFSSGIAGHEFSDPQFWFYYSQVNRFGNTASPELVDNIDMIRELKRQDVVILLCNEAKLYDLGWGFIDTAYHDLTCNVKYDSLKENKIRNYEAQINRDANWLEQTKVKAKSEHFPLDKMIRKEAEYMLEQEKKK